MAGAFVARDIEIETDTTVDLEMEMYTVVDIRAEMGIIVDFRVGVFVDLEVNIEVDIMSHRGGQLRRHQGGHHRRHRGRLGPRQVRVDMLRMAIAVASEYLTDPFANMGGDMVDDIGADLIFHTRQHWRLHQGCWLERGRHRL